MKGGASYYNSLPLGIALFASSIILTQGIKLDFSLFRMFGSNNNNRRLRSRGDRDQSAEELPPGRLVLANSRLFFGVRWRNDIKFSSEDEEELSEAECEMEIINNFDETVLVCWIDPQGTLRNYYPINDGSIKDGSVSNKHCEFTFRNHSFVVIRQSIPLPQKVKDIKKENFLLAYTPLKAKHRHFITMSKPSPSSGRNIIDVALESSPIESDEDNQVIVTANKEYLCKSICGFLVNYEPDVFDSCPTLEAGYKRRNIPIPIYIYWILYLRTPYIHIYTV
jgi:hypothetical protein